MSTTSTSFGRQLRTANHNASSNDTNNPWFCPVWQSGIPYTGPARGWRESSAPWILAMAGSNPCVHRSVRLRGSCHWQQMDTVSSTLFPGVCGLFIVNRKRIHGVEIISILCNGLFSGTEYMYIPGTYRFSLQVEQRARASESICWGSNTFLRETWTSQVQTN